MLRTNSKKYIENMNKYLCLCLSDDEFQSDDIVESKKYALDRFRKEYDSEYERRRYPNKQIRVAEWLSGLPFRFDYGYGDILEVAESLHECKIPEDMENVITQDWWKHLAYFILKG